MNNLRYLFVFCCMILSSCRKESTLLVLQTSDVHGSVFPYDFIRDHSIPASLSQVSQYVKESRSKQPVLLLDNGDILQGQPLVYYANYIDTSPVHVMARMMNYMHYDAGTVGNHDIEAGPRVYKKLVDEFDFPWLAANVIDTLTGKPFFLPYALIKKSGLRIAVIGLTTTWVTNWLPEQLWKGLRFEDMEQSARQWLKIVERKEHPDLIIGLFHTGYGGPGSNKSAEDLSENAACSIAANVPGFDIVLCGHDHREMDTVLVNTAGDSVIVLNPGSNARTLAQVALHIEKRGLKRKITYRKGTLLEVKDFHPDSAFLDAFNPDFLKVKEYVMQPVGTLLAPLSSRDALFGPSNFTDLVHKIQLDITGADISFTAALSMNASLPQGQILVRDLFSLYRYENFLYTMDLSGEEIRNYLEYSYALWFRTMKNASDYLLQYRMDEAGNPLLSRRSQAYELKSPSYSFDSARGIHYIVDVSKEPGQRITILGMEDGRPFDLLKTYRVAINSYRGSGGGGHLEKGAGLSAEERIQRIRSSTDHDLRSYMMEWFRAKGEVNPVFEPCWSVIPSSWVDQARKREYPMLFK